MRTLVHAYFAVVKAAMVALMVGMVGLVFGNVVLRYALNSGLTASEELSRLFFVWITFLGSILAMHDHSHLGFDGLVRRLPPGAARAVTVVACALVLGALGLLAQGAARQAAINLSVGAPATGVSMAWFYGAAVVFSVSGIAITLWNLWQTLAASGAPVVLVSEAEGLGELELPVVNSEVHSRGPAVRHIGESRP